MPAATVRIGLTALRSGRRRAPAATVIAVAPIAGIEFSANQPPVEATLAWTPRRSIGTVCARIATTDAATSVPAAAIYVHRLYDGRNDHTPSPIASAHHAT